MRDRTGIQGLGLGFRRRAATSTAKEAQNGDERFGRIDSFLFAFGLIFGAYPGHDEDEQLDVRGAAISPDLRMMKTDEEGSVRSNPS